MRSAEISGTATRSAWIIFPAIVLAQFCGTSLWFAGNAAVLSLHDIFRWPDGATGHLTTSVQAGFILGTLTVTLTGVADRVSPSKLFFFSCAGGAICNSIPLLDIGSFPLCIVSRALTGIFLGGIYPVGMKIAADWREQGLGDWLGALVGALVFGTALPHGLRTLDVLREPLFLLPVISAIAFLGGLLLLLLVSDGPYRKKSARFSLRHLSTVLRTPTFRSPLFGYFGHMWELYTFWAMVPWILNQYFSEHPELRIPVSLLAFVVIAVGGVGCWAGGKLSLITGSLPVARAALLASGICCLLTPFIWSASFSFFLIFLIVWGLTVVADSPQFSALIAANSPADKRGTALTFATCVGFTITIISIQIVQHTAHLIASRYLLLLLVPGPILGLFFSRKQKISPPL